MIEAFLDAVKNNPEIATVLVAIALDFGMGVIPDKYWKYIGLIRRIAQKLMKKKGMKMLLLLPLLVAVGCAFTQPSTICETDKPSLICKRLSNPEQADVLLQVANIQGLKNDVYSGEEALKFLDFCEQLINKSTTYFDMTNYISNVFDDYELEVLILSRYMPKLAVDIPITNYDRQLLLAHIQHQREVISMYMEE